MNAQTKEKLIVAGWKLFWKSMQIVMTILTAVSTILALWDWSYTTRGYGAIGGEIVLAILVAFIVWKAMGIIADWHKSVRTEEETAIKIICEGREFIIKERK